MKLIEKIIGKILSKNAMIKTAYIARLESQKELKEKVNKAGFDNAKDFVEELERKASKKWINNIHQISLFFFFNNSSKNFISTGNVLKEDKYSGDINRQRESDKVFAVVQNKEIVNGKIKKYKN